MRLEWKYTLIINVFILVTMTVFFIINDRVVRRESVLSVIRDYSRGATMREIAGEIRESITGKSDPDELARIIRSVDLSKWESEVVDINVMDDIGIVAASLTGKALDDQLDSDGYNKVIASEQVRVRYPPKGYYGYGEEDRIWVIDYTLPYIRSISPVGDKELGALQILFSAQGIASQSRRLRMEYLFYVGIATIALTVFINPLTGYLIVRRLERLMDTIAAAQAGDLGVRAIDSSQDEIGRLSRGFNRMIEQISSEHASRLQALGNLAAGVAHEVRNPLNSIAMTTQYLKDTFGSKSQALEKLDESDSNLAQTLKKSQASGKLDQKNSNPPKPDSRDDEIQECLDVITQQVKELDRIVKQFLQLTRPVEMNWEIVDLNLFLVDVLRSFALSLEVAGVKLLPDFSRELLYVKIDRDKLRQAISNIIINSIQAMPDGGELRVATALDVPQRGAVIEISDTGIGIPQGNIDRLFEPYFTTKPDGIGLGLAITYRMIEAHDGEINVESEEGKGTKFTIVLHK